MRRLADFLLRYRLPLLLIALGITLFASVPASRLTFDQSIESLFSESSPNLKNYRSSKSRFGGDEFAMVAYTDPDLFSSDGLDRLRQFAKKLSQVPGVQEASTQDLADALAPQDASFVLKLLLGTREREMRELVRGLLVGDDDRTTAVILRLLPEAEAPLPRAETIARLRDLAGDHPLTAYVVGEPVQVHDMFRYLERDGELLFRVSLGMLALVLFLLFRSVRWVVLPVLVVVVTLCWTEALLVLSGMQLSMVSSMLNSLTTIIGIATVTHVIVHFLERRREHGPAESFRQTFLELGPPVFWTCATTAAGFAVLLSSHISPVQSFGMMMALSTLLVLVVAACVLPGGMLIGSGDRGPRKVSSEHGSTQWVNRVTDWVALHPLLLSLGTACFVAFAAAGIWRLEVETDFSKNFRASSPIVRSLDFVETRLGGSGTWEVNFPAPRKLSNEYLDRVRRLAQKLRGLSSEGEEQLTKVVSLTDAVDLIPQIPFTKNTVAEKLERLREFQPEYETNLYDSHSARMRILLRSRERQPSQRKLRLIDQVEELTRQEFPEAKATGLFVLLTFLIENLLDDQLTSFLLAVVVISGMMSVAFRSLAIGLISLVPNLFPIILVIGGMGWLGLSVNIGTAMIASISIGLTTDSTIHYITAFRHARGRGLDASAAVREANKSAGRAIVFATLALVVGFSVLTLSNFIPLVYFGALVSTAMVGGLFGDLVLLPLLLRSMASHSARCIASPIVPPSELFLHQSRSRLTA